MDRWRRPTTSMAFFLIGALPLQSFAAAAKRPPPTKEDSNKGKGVSTNFFGIGSNSAAPAASAHSDDGRSRTEHNIKPVLRGGNSSGPTIISGRFSPANVQPTGISQGNFSSNALQPNQGGGGNGSGSPAPQASPGAGGGNDGNFAGGDRPKKIDLPLNATRLPDESGAGDGRKKNSAPSPDSNQGGTPPPTTAPPSTPPPTAAPPSTPSPTTTP